MFDFLRFIREFAGWLLPWHGQVPLTMIVARTRGDARAIALHRFVDPSGVLVLVLLLLIPHRTAAEDGSPSFGEGPSEPVLLPLAAPPGTARRDGVSENLARPRVGRQRRGHPSLFAKETDPRPCLPFRVGLGRSTAWTFYESSLRPWPGSRRSLALGRRRKPRISVGGVSSAARRRGEHGGFVCSL